MATDCTEPTLITGYGHRNKIIETQTTFDDFGSTRNLRMKRKPRNEECRMHDETMLRKVIFIVTIAITFVCSICNGEIGAEDAVIDLTPKCASVLLSCGVLGGAGLALSMTPTALCTAGFFPTGGSSFAAGRRSTPPFVSAGGLFATLQSVAIGRSGTKLALAGSVLGGKLSATYLDALCVYIDDPDSTMASVFDATHLAVQGTLQAKNKVRNACSSSESCAATVDLVQSATSSVSSVWSYIAVNAGQALEVMSNKTETLLLEGKISSLERKRKELMDNTYSGQMIGMAKNRRWLQESLNWLSGGTVKNILELEKKIQVTEARLTDLNPVNE